MSYKKCPVIIFYEKHSDKYPAETITSLLSLLKGEGVGVFAAEEPYNESAKSFISALKQINKQYSDVLKDSASLNASYENQKLVSKDSSLTFSDFKAMISNTIASYKATINLVQATLKESIHYKGIDMSRGAREKLYDGSKNINEITELRNEHMVNKIVTLCNVHKAGIVTLLGLNHLDLESTLKAKGFDILSLYIAGQKPEFAHDHLSSISNSDFKVREHDVEFQKQYQHNINVIDLYKNPDIDHVQQAKELIETFFEKSEHTEL